MTSYQKLKKEIATLRLELRESRADLETLVEGIDTEKIKEIRFKVSMIKFEREWTKKVEQALWFGTSTTLSGNGIAPNRILADDSGD